MFQINLSGGSIDDGLKEKKEPEQGGTHLGKCCNHLGGRHQGLEVILENKRLI